MSIANLDPKNAAQEPPEALLDAVKGVFATFNNTMQSIVKMARVPDGLGKDMATAHEKQADAVIEASSGISKIELQTLDTTKDVLTAIKESTKLGSANAKGFADGLDKVAKILDDRLPKPDKPEKEKSVFGNLMSLVYSKKEDKPEMATPSIAKTPPPETKASSIESKSTILNSVTTNESQTSVDQSQSDSISQSTDFQQLMAMPTKTQSLESANSSLEKAEKTREEKTSGFDMKGLIKGIGEAPVFGAIAQSTKATASAVGSLASVMWTALLGLGGAIVGVVGTIATAVAPFLPLIAIIIGIGVGIGAIALGIKEAFSRITETFKLLQDNKKEIDRQAKVSDKEVDRLETEKKSITAEKEAIKNDASLTPEEKTKKLEELTSKEQNTDRKIAGTQGVKAQGKINDGSRGLFNIGAGGEAALAAAVPGGAAGVSLLQRFGIIDDNTKIAEGQKEFEAAKKNLSEIEASKRISENQKMHVEFDKSPKQPIFVNNPTTNTSVSNGQSVMIAPSNTTKESPRF